MKYNIASITISLDSSFCPGVSWQLFEETDGIEEFDIVCTRPPLRMINRDLSFAECGGMEKVFMLEGSFALSDKTFRHSYLSTSGGEDLSILLAYLFYSHAIKRGMLKVHCSVVEDRGRGILFLGPSGIGKTTQAERWAQYRKARIINGDVGFVQQTSEGYVAWGTPWHGSSPYCENASVPVKALVVLKQSPENALRLLTGFEKVAEVSGSILHPTWMEDGVEQCAVLLNDMLNDLSVYRLDNRADEEAVQILAEEIDRIV